MSSDDGTDPTEESDNEFDSELDRNADMCMEDVVDTPEGIELRGDVDVDRDGDDQAEEDAQMEDKEEQDMDDDDGKNSRTIGQGEMVNISADHIDTMVDNQPIVLPKQGQEMCEHTPRLQPPAPASRPQTPEPRP
jgi:hypothetical protein